MTLFSSPLLVSVFLLLSVSSSLSLSVNEFPQSCADLTTTYVSYDALTTCLFSVPFNATIAAQTLETLQLMVPSYAFIDISKSSPDPNIPMKVDVVNLLKNIQTKVATSAYVHDVSFQSDVAGVMSALQDAHTRYSKPSPYRNAMFLQPFFLMSLVDTKGNQYIRLVYNSDWVAAYKTVYGQDPFTQNFDSYVVKAIDGQDPITYIQQFAQNVGYSKDPGSRFNLAIDGYGGTFYGLFTARNQTLLDAPTNNNVTWTLAATVDSTTTFTESVYFLGKYNNFTNPAPSYAAASGTFNGSKKRVVVHELEEMRQDANRAAGAPIHHMYTLLPKGERASSKPVVDVAAAAAVAVDAAPGTLVTIVNDTLNGVTAQLVNNTVGVLKIGTWAPSNETNFAQSVISGLVNLTANNIEKLILDLRLNGGGDICLAYAALRFLFPDVAPTVGTYDMKHSDLWDLFVQKGAALQKTYGAGSTACGTDPEQLGYFTPCAWSAPTGTGVEFVPFADDSWFNPGQTYTRGNVANSKYSSFIHEGCQDAYNLWIPHKVLTNLTVDDIFIVTDGLCGSSCAVFARHLQQIRKAKTIALGGIVNTNMGIASFPGGEVEDLPFVFSMAEKYGVNTSDPRVPQPFPNNAMFRYAIREIYPFVNTSQTSQTPLEFVFDAADFRVYYGESSGYYPGDSSPLALYNAVSGYFSSCAPWQSKPCTVGNGVGVLSCINQSYSKTCAVTLCNAGFGSADAGTCDVCPVGTYSDGKGTKCTACTNAPPNSYYTNPQETTPVCSYNCEEGYSGLLCDTVVAPQNGYSSGAVAGAAVGSLLAGVIVTVVFVFIYNKRRSTQYERI